MSSRAYRRRLGANELESVESEEEEEHQIQAKTFAFDLLENEETQELSSDSSETEVSEPEVAQVNQVPIVEAIKDEDEDFEEALLALRYYFF